MIQHFIYIYIYMIYDFLRYIQADRKQKIIKNKYILKITMIKEKVIEEIVK